MTTPAEKDAMALAVLDEHADDIAHDDLHSGIARKENRAIEQRTKYRAAVTHLAARVAELEASFSALDLSYRARYDRQVADIAEREARATSAEAELAAVRANAERYVWLRDRAALGFISTLDMRREPDEWDAEIDAARGAG